MSDFKIENGKFLLNGNEFKIISGAIHYFRVVPEYWEDRLLKLRAMGCNTVETYVAWNLHEPQPGTFCFSGALDLEKFIVIAQEIGLYVIVRPSPYICGEWEFGGLPAWLLGDHAVSVRTKSRNFLSYVDGYYRELLPRLAPYQIQNGGPIILMQVENEYGAYGNDTAYMEFLCQLMRKYKITVPLITADNFEQEFSRGLCSDALPTANFGSGTQEKFSILAKYNHGGPLMCTEFWVGWYDAWGDQHHHTADIAAAARELDNILAQGSVNIYMFHGGTNFGFMNGANDYDKLTADVTSYDYDAPLAEDGTITDKYRAFQSVIAKYTSIPKLAISQSPHKTYGFLHPDGYVCLLDCLDLLSQGIIKTFPCSMEDIGQSYGYTLYSTVLPHKISCLELDDAHDRVQMFANHIWIDSLFDREIPGKHFVDLPEGTNLHLLVENMGRVNYGPKLDQQRKGLNGMVYADGQPLTNWECRPLTLNNISNLKYAGVKENAENKEPAFYHFTLDIQEPADTFLKLPGWGKGCVFINNFNLGRFWNIGPQTKMYLPAPLLKKGCNDIVILETEGCRGNVIEFV